jgi:hypothetical protein
MPPNRQNHMHRSYQHFYGAVATRVGFTGLPFPGPGNPLRLGYNSRRKAFENQRYNPGCWSDSYKITWRTPQDVVTEVPY